MEFLVVVKRDCETCQMVGPVLAGLKALPLTLYSQTSPAFPEEAGGARDDRGLEESWRRKIEVVPTVIRIEDGEEIERAEGWDRNEWQRITGQGDLSAGLPDFKPVAARARWGNMPERLSLQFGGMHFGGARYRGICGDGRPDGDRLRPGLDGRSADPRPADESPDRADAVRHDAKAG